MPAFYPTRHLQVADVLALRPGDRIVVHPVTEALVVMRDGQDASRTARDRAHRSFAPPGTLQAGNLEKILDCVLETRMVLRSEDGLVLQVLRLDAANWGHLLQHEGSTVDLLVNGRKIARGRVVCGDPGDGLQITEMVCHERTGMGVHSPR